MKVKCNNETKAKERNNVLISKGFSSRKKEISLRIAQQKVTFSLVRKERASMKV